jgi:hypothetical protein
MSLKMILCASFSSEMLRLSELRNALIEYEELSTSTACYPGSAVLYHSWTCFFALSTLALQSSLPSIPIRVACTLFFACQKRELVPVTLNPTFRSLGREKIDLAISRAK